MDNQPLTLRAVTAEDTEFLVRLYGSTRAAELALVPWTPEQCDSFIRFQFNAQSAYYKEQFPAAEHSIILYNGESVGRLYLHHRVAEIRILDLTIAPEFRGRGFGQQIIQPLMAEATLNQKPLTIHLVPYDRSCRLFERLGFHKVSDNNAIALFEWQPPVPLPENAA